MELNPVNLLLSLILVGTVGWVIRGLMASWFKLKREDHAGANSSDMEDRLRKIESTMASLVIEVQSIREKDRFMAKLQATASTREISGKSESSENDVSPLMTQSIPVIPRVRLPR
jgi:hypothetical protein